MTWASLENYILYRLSTHHGLYIKPFFVDNTILSLENTRHIIMLDNSNAKNFQIKIQTLVKLISNHGKTPTVTQLDTLFENLNPSLSKPGRIFVLAEFIEQLSTHYHKQGKPWIITSLLTSLRKYTIKHHSATSKIHPIHDPSGHSRFQVFILGTLFGIGIALTTCLPWRSWN